jgi:[ribosomal protein S5]-alanine N-acetyltransferase
MATQLIDRFAETVTATRRTESTDWRKALPVLHRDGFSLRELRAGDAAPLLALLTTEEVTRFISPPPKTIEGFERFISWANSQREAGRYVCFAIVPDGCDTAVGLFQVRQLDGSFETAEWGFALASEFWGSGLFMAGAEAILEFSFDTLGVHRLEARPFMTAARASKDWSGSGGCLEKIISARR